MVSMRTVNARKPGQLRTMSMYMTVTPMREAPMPIGTADSCLASSAPRAIASYLRVLIRSSVRGVNNDPQQALRCVRVQDADCLRMRTQ